MFYHQKLKCYGMALDVAKNVPTITNSWPRGTAYLIDQLRRAISSVVLNIAEGNGRRGAGERRRFFTIAQGSAAEVASIFDVAHALNYLPHELYADLQDRLLQIVKMLYKLR